MSLCCYLLGLSYQMMVMCQLVELKNGETYNGHLVNCDTWMNIHLREVICTSKVVMSTNTFTKVYNISYHVVWNFIMYQT